MVSIGESISELERIYKLHTASLECYHAALESLAQYAVELDDSITTPYRTHLTGLASALRAEVTPQTLTQNRATLRHELRDYRDKAAAFLSNLRQGMSEKAETLQAIVESMAAVDGDHEARFGDALRKLRELSTQPAAAPVRAGLESVSSQLEQSIEEMKKQNQLTVTQFLVEIRTLHSRIETLRAASAQDVLTHLASRVEIEERISSEVELQRPFCLVLVRICNLPELDTQFGAQIRDDAIGAFAKRMCNGMPADTLIGRWSDDQFVAVLARHKSEAIDLAKHLTPRLSGTYVCMENGVPRKPKLQVKAAVIDRSAGGSCQGLIDSIDHYL